MRRSGLRLLSAALWAGEAQLMSAQAANQACGFAARLPLLGADACRGAAACSSGIGHAWTPQRFASSIVYPPVEAFVGSKAPDFKSTGESLLGNTEHACSSICWAVVATSEKALLFCLVPGMWWAVCLLSSAQGV